MTDHTASNTTTTNADNLACPAARPCFIHVLVVNPPSDLGFSLKRRSTQLRIDAVVPGSLLTKTPLRRGDVIVRINKLPIIKSRERAMDVIRKSKKALELTVLDYNGDRGLRSTTILWNTAGSTTVPPAITFEAERDYWVVTSVPRIVRRLTKIQPGSECVGVQGKPLKTLEHVLSDEPTTFLTRLSSRDLPPATMGERMESCCENCAHCCRICCYDI